MPPGAVILPVPANGTHGCWLESPVPLPTIVPAPNFAIVPLPFAAIVTVLPSTFVDAVPA